MKITIDNKNDALYFRLDDKAIVESEEIRKDFIFDYDADDKIIGIEILNISNKIPLDKLKNFQFESQ